MTDLEKAKNIFSEGKYTVVLCKDDDVVSSETKGINPLVEFLESDIDFSDYSVCDKVVGRAAAFLYVLMGVKEVHASIMAKLAIQILDRAEIKYSADQFVETIENQSRTGIDPIEEAVIRSGSPVKAFEDIKNKLESI